MVHARAKSNTLRLCFPPLRSSFRSRPANATIPFLLSEWMPHGDRTPQGRQHLSPMRQRFSRRGRSYDDVADRVRLWIRTMVAVQFRHRQSQLYSLGKDIFDRNIST